MSFTSLSTSDGVRRPSFAVLIGAAFAALIVVSLVAASLTASRWHARDREREIRQFMQLKAEQFARAIALGLDDRKRILDLSSRRAVLAAAERNPAEARQLLDLLQKNWPEFVWIGVTDASGRIVASSGGVLTGDSAAARDWFQRGLDGPFVGGVHEAKLLKGNVRLRADGEPARLMDLALPLHDAAGQRVGVIAAHLDDIWLDSMRRFIAQTSSDGQPYRLVLLDRDGTPIAADHGGGTPYAAADGAVISHVAAMPAGSTPAALGWRAQVVFPTATLQGEVRRFQQRALAAGLAGALLCAPLVWFLSFRLARPIRALRDSLRSGNALDPGRVPVGGTAETAMLGLATRDLLSEVRQQRDALAASEVRLRALLEAAPDAIISVDASQQIVLANAAAEAVFGRPAADLVGQPLAELIPVRLRERHAAHLAGLARSARRAGAMGRGELLALRADGSEFPIEASIFRTDVGGEIRMTAILRDITARRLAEDELRDTARRYRHLFLNHPVPMWVYDTQTLAFLEVNDLAIARYGWSRDEFLARSIFDIRPPEEAQRLRDRLRGHLPSFQSTGPWTHVTRFGERIQVMVMGHNTDWDGRSARLVAVQDVTALLAAQAQLERQQRALSALSRELITKEASERAALAQVLHDRFAQNLVAARLTVEMVVQQQRAALAADPAQADLQPGLGTVVDLLGEAIRDVRGLLSDLRPPLLDDFGLRSALEHELERRRAASDATLRLEVEATPDGAAGRPERAVEYALFMIVREAIHNAVMHARAHEIVVGLAVADSEARVIVTDDGVGFDGSVGATPVGHLGLVGMRERAQTIGARLQIDSAPGRGSRIEVHWLRASPLAPGGAA